MIMVRDIQRAFAKQFKLPIEAMNEPDGVGARVFERSHPRQMAMTVSMILTTHSLVRVGQFFGGRDHSTVLNAVRKTERRCAEDPEAREAMRSVARKLLLEEAGNG